MTWSYDIPKMVPKEIAQQKRGDVGVYGIAELNSFMQYFGNCNLNMQYHGII